jgi:transposase
MPGRDLGHFTTMSEVLNALAALYRCFDFWRFIFGRQFRRQTLAGWRSRRWFGKALIPLEVLLYTTFGLAPILVVLILLGVL